MTIPVVIPLVIMVVFISNHSFQYTPSYYRRGGRVAILAIMVELSLIFILILIPMFIFYVYFMLIFFLYDNLLLVKLS